MVYVINILNDKKTLKYIQDRIGIIKKKLGLDKKN